MAEVNAPTFTQEIDQKVFIEPLGGPTNPANALDRFPDAIYDKSPDTHFVKFMYSLLGPAGVGWIKKQYLDAKLKLYAQGFTSFDIEKYYGDPFRFGRILLEELPEDPEGLLSREEWETIKSRDESYRNRAITYFNAIRAGGTPEGIELAAQSGLNHAAFVIENYKALFDAHSDEPLGLPHYGKTESTEEFIVVPRQTQSRSEQQIISFADVTAIEGYFQLEYNGQITSTLAYNVNHFQVEEALTKLGNIGEGALTVTGGPNPNPFIVTFTGPLANQDVPTIRAISGLKDSSGANVLMSVRVLVGGIDGTDEVVRFSDEYAHNMQTAVDFLRPVNSLPTTYSGSATKTRQEYSSVHASSSYVEAVKYVTGSENVDWPEPDSLNWIEPGKEKEARRIQGDLQSHYVNHHSVAGVTAYTDAALTDPQYNTLVSALEKYKSEHVGEYDPDASFNFTFLSSAGNDLKVYGPGEAVPSCPIPLNVKTIFEPLRPINRPIGGPVIRPFVEGTTSVEALGKEGSGSLSLQKRYWWSSLERTAPNGEFLELDLGSTKMVNWISFDITRKPVNIALDYDYLDEEPEEEEGTVTAPRQWRSVLLWSAAGGGETPVGETIYHAQIHYAPLLPPWQNIKLFFRDGDNTNIATRYLRLRFDRPETSLTDPNATFVRFRNGAAVRVPYSIDVRNLRTGRYAGTSVTWDEAE